MGELAHPEEACKGYSARGSKVLGWPLEVVGLKLRRLYAAREADYHLLRNGIADSLCFGRKEPAAAVYEALDLLIVEDFQREPAVNVHRAQGREAL
jgi:hypothetical protein